MLYNTRHFKVSALHLFIFFVAALCKSRIRIMFSDRMIERFDRCVAKEFE